MPNRSNSDNLIRVIFVAALAIIAAIIVFETQPSAENRIPVVCNNCSYDVNQKPTYADKLVDPVSIFTLFLVISTVLLWRSTERLANLAATQSDDMAKSIAEAARSAGAMERVAESLSINAQSVVESVEQNRSGYIRQRQFMTMQTRAYISVFINQGQYQERDNNIRFAVIPRIQNSGITPAHRVKIRAKAAILPYPLPEEHKFTLEEPTKGESIIQPRQDVTFTRFVENYIPDEEVETVKKNAGRAVYVWGVVLYRHVFKINRRTTFCHSIRWVDYRDPSKGSFINGAYLPRHNKAS